MAEDTDVLVAESTRRHHIPKRNWKGRRKGERLKYRWKKRPYVHQVAGVKKLLASGWGGALLMEPRTGKTKIAVDYASILHQAGKVNRVLIVGPVNAIGVWKDEIEANCPFPYRYLVWNRKTRRRTRGNKVNPHFQELPRFGDDILDFVFVNYDAFATPARFQRDRKTGEIRRDEMGKPKRSQGRGGRYEIRDKIETWQPQLIILDESHRIKNPTAAKSRTIISLRNVAQYRVIMTGTVVTKKKRLFDVWAQWQFLNPQRFRQFDTFGDFRKYVGRWTERNGFPQWLRNIPKREDEIHQLIHLDAFSQTRDQCYDLPKKNPHQIIRVDLDESADIYDQMAEEMVAKIKSGEITEASISLVQAIRLRQITSGLARTTPSEKYPEGRLVIIGSEKLRVWQSRLEDLMEADEKLVVGAMWKADILRLKRVCEKLKVPVFVIQGGMKEDAREYARTQFPKVSGGAVFIGQPRAAGEAIDLSCASIMQWYSLTPSWVDYQQFSDRIALSQRPTFYEFFLAEGTVDHILYETLQEDGNLGRKMITSPDRLIR